MNNKINKYMKKENLIKWGAINSFGVFVYVLLVTVFMNQANNWFGREDQFITPAAVLMLFVFSALVTGGLILGKPIMLYLDGEKKSAVKLLFFTGIGIFIFMALTFISLSIMK